MLNKKVQILEFSLCLSSFCNRKRQRKAVYILLEALAPINLKNIDIANISSINKGKSRTQINR